MNLGFLALILSLFKRNEDGSIWEQIRDGFKSREDLLKEDVDVDKSEELQKI